MTSKPYLEHVKRRIRENMPYDSFVRELLTAQGKVWDNPAIGYYMRDRGMPLDNMANTTRIFLGTRIECAQCHNHPFDKWSQMQFFKMAAFTYGVQTQDYNGGIMGDVRDLLREQEDAARAAIKEPQRPQRPKISGKMTKEERAAAEKAYTDAYKKYEAEMKIVQVKRRDKVALESYRDEGYLAEAMVNYLMTLGWSPGEQENQPWSAMQAAFALEDVAAEANLSRATIYRHFPGGRTQLINDTVTREVARFWGELADHVRPLAAIEDRLVVGLMEARRRIDEYDLLQRLVASEPDDLLPALSESDQLVQLAIMGYIKDLISREQLVDGLDLETAAEYLTRMLLSHIGTAGRWDLTDRTQVERLVRTQFLAGIIQRQ